MEEWCILKMQILKQMILDLTTTKLIKMEGFGHHKKVALQSTEVVMIATQLVSMEELLLYHSMAL